MIMSDRIAATPLIPEIVSLYRWGKLCVIFSMDMVAEIVNSISVVQPRYPYSSPTSTPLAE